jgi:peptidyl-tRNA hydrolase
MKQVIVVDDSLQLPTGKLAAQVAHAAVGAMLEASAPARREWLSEGMPKVVLRCDSPEALLALETAAAKAGLPCCLVHDAGRTVIAAGTATCVGIGPAPIEAVDAITGHLKLR